MEAAQMRTILRLSSSAFDAEIDLKIRIADAELARVGVNTASTDPNVAALLDYAREMFCKSEFNFDGRGELYAARFEGVRDAMKLTGACTDVPNGAASGTQEATT